MAEISPFGTTADGTEVRRIVLQSAQLQVGLLTWGCALQSVRLAGVSHDLTLGSGLLADYEGPMPYHGTLIGPIANRLAGARTRIAGQVWQFAPNEGPNLLHSGPTGIQSRVWALTEADAVSATLTLTLPDGDLGPGTRHITARWSLDGATLRLDLSGGTDAPGLMMLANHSYWNLDGTPSWAGHRLELWGTGLLATDAAGLPTGQITPLPDLSRLTPGDPALDQCLTLGHAPRALTPAARLTGASGVALTLHTTDTGCQVYDGRNSARPGRAPCEGIALEAQGWPDAPNHPDFPSIAISPDRPYHQTTEWRFTAP